MLSAHGLMPFDDLATSLRTFVNLHIGNGLPFIHGNIPRTASSSTAQVDDQLRSVVIKCLQHASEAIH